MSPRAPDPLRALRLVAAMLLLALALVLMAMEGLQMFPPDAEKPLVIATFAILAAFFVLAL